MSVDEECVDAGAVAIARMLAGADERTKINLVHRLRREARLSRTVHSLNLMLEQPALRPLGLEALKSIGLERAG
jgi:hypothetical protein